MEDSQQKCISEATSSITINDPKVVDLSLLDEFTRDGSHDWHGKPAIRRRSGGWTCAMLILVNEGLFTLAFAGVEVNMVLFTKSVLRYSNAEAANTFSRWMGAVSLFSLMGAFISDSYLGRYLTCFIFQIVLIVGLIALSFSTQSFLQKPKGCGKTDHLCEPHKPIEIAMFYLSTYLIALGNGATEPALATFGADQFDEEDEKEKQAKTSFYSYFYVALNLGSLVSETIVIYLETMGHWVLGYWLCAGSGLVAFLFLLSGTIKYRRFRTSGNPLSRFCQVIVAALRKSKLDVYSNREKTLHEVHGGDYENNGMRNIRHTEDFRFLDRAAIITSDETNKDENVSPWQVCTITQVEEVKCILRLLPIWSCTILSSVVFIQMLSLFVEQGAAMNRTIWNFQIPPASMTVFDIVSTSAFILLYDKMIVPLYVKVTKREPKPPSELKRMGIGLSIGIVAMIIAGIIEQYRLKHASLHGKETSSVHILWQTPQYVLVGVSEAFVYVAQMEFFASQAPDGLKSLGIGLSMFSSAMGSFVCSLILTLVMAVTSRNGKPGWVPHNLNDGHLDRFFFLSAAITLLNLGLFIVCAKRFKAVSFEKRKNDISSYTVS